MSRITDAIAPARFEEVRDAIATILITEFTAQAALQTDPELIETLNEAKVYSEMFRPPNASELPALQVFLFSAEYDNQNPTAARGQYIFYIDTFLGSAEGDSDFGDQLASKKSHALIGIIRGILSHPHWICLGFDPAAQKAAGDEAFIHHSHIMNIKRMEEENTRDADSIMMYRIILEVVLTENTRQIPTGPLVASDTDVRIDTTDLGFQYVVEFP